MNAIFITATGAEVGETLVTASLIGHLRQLGHQVEAIKPIVSGYEPAQAVASGPGVLLAALGLPFSPQEIDRTSPWRFRAPVAPELAARREGRSINVDQVIAFCQSAIEQRRDVLLVEGVGGIMVPLDGNRTMLDVMMALRLPVILVGGSYRGGISHTLTALDSLFRRDIDVLATVINETPSSATALEEVVATIARFTEPVIGMPRPRQGAHPGVGDPFGRIFGSKGGPKHPAG